MFGNKKKKELISRLIEENKKLKEEMETFNQNHREQQKDLDLLTEKSELDRGKLILDKTIERYKKLILEVKEIKKQSKRELEEAKELKVKYREEFEKLIVALKKNE